MDEIEKSIELPLIEKFSETRDRVLEWHYRNYHSVF